MEVIVPSLAETKLTGFLGAVERTVRGHAYRVGFELRAAPTGYCIVALPLRDGRSAAWCKITRKLDMQGRKFFSFTVAA